MHGGSGLLAEVVRADASLATVDTALRSWLYAPRWTPSEKDGCGRCGSSVHFDREFVRRYLPRSFELFGHRIVDVSTVKTMVKMWWPGMEYDARTTKAHRAALDVQASIEELRYYRSLMKVFEPATES
jgi:oligoribonuclease